MSVATQTRTGFIVRSNGGWYNILVYDDTKKKFVFSDQSITSLDDAVMFMQEDNIFPVLHQSVTLEPWMTEDAPQE